MRNGEWQSDVEIIEKEAQRILQENGIFTDAKEVMDKRLYETFEDLKKIHADSNNAHLRLAENILISANSLRDYFGNGIDEVFKFYLDDDERDGRGDYDEEFWLDELKDDVLGVLNKLNDLHRQFYFMKFLYAVPEYQRDPFLLQEIEKHLSIGIKRELGGKKGRLNRRRKATEQNVIQALNSAYIKYPQLGITALREAAAEQLGVSSKTISRTTKYDPRKS